MLVLHVALLSVAERMSGKGSKSLIVGTSQSATVLGCPSEPGSHVDIPAGTTTIGDVSWPTCVLGAALAMCGRVLYTLHILRFTLCVCARVGNAVRLRIYPESQVLLCWRAACRQFCTNCMPLE